MLVLRTGDWHPAFHPASVVLAEGWTLAPNFHMLAKSAAHNGREKAESLESAGAKQTETRIMSEAARQDGGGGEEPWGHCYCRSPQDLSESSE